ncbi:helix-turn-helix transcriptional regulator [bacterium]|nr:helix-turn-helix transcriptional regulator [bacterium]
MNTQGQRLKNIRLALRLSQEEFGKIFDITKQYVYSLEKDKITLNNEKLVKLLVDYNVNINYLLCGIGDMFLNSSNSDGYSNIRNEILNEVRSMLISEGVIK